MRNVHIGNIGIKNNYTLVEVDEKAASQLVTSLEQEEINGNPLRVEITQERPAPKRRSQGGDSRG